MRLGIGPGYFLLLPLLVTLPWLACHAENNQQNAVQHGELNISGSFLEAPCRIAMRSALQDVNLESASLVNLQHTGDVGQPQQIVFHMLGCKTASGDNKALKREATVRFLSQADPDEPTLFKLQGVTGIALRLEDVNGRLILPGERRTPLFQASTNDLIYRVVPVRTQAPLSTGEFNVTVDFGMSYE